MQGGEVFDEDSFEIRFLKIGEIEISKNEFFGLFQDFLLTRKRLPLVNSFMGWGLLTW